MGTEVIRDAALYSGVRISVPSRIDRAKAVLRLDVNVGDPVTPDPVDVEYPLFLTNHSICSATLWPPFSRRSLSR
jgi:hypothetical protein